MRMSETNSEQSRILKGIGGSRGVARGPVKLIYNMRELDKIRNGDVLVSQMTNPDMILVMKKCAAIVTDSGGLVCHAATIAREVGIPCVVGTGSATKLLKDGMIVEVDGTKGTVSIMSDMGETRQSVNLQEDFIMFGNKLNCFSKKMHRDKPFWPDDWEFDWPTIDLEIEYQWVLPRPEIIVTPLTYSLIIPALERIPFILGLSDIGPLYSECHYTVSIRFDKLRKVKAQLQDNLLSMNEPFLTDYKQRLYRSYGEFDNVTLQIMKKRNVFSKLKDDELISMFKQWWKAHEQFFSLTFFIQSMGDDIVWPKIKEMLESVIGNEDTVMDFISILTLPTSIKEIVISGQFNKDTTNLLEKAPQRVRDLISSTLSESEILSETSKLDEGQLWGEKLTRYTQKWWWMRTRDLYFEVKNSREEMLKFIRSSIDAKPSSVNLTQNRLALEKKMKYLMSVFPDDDYKRLAFYVDLGRFLSRERDNHHHVWLKNTSMMKELILELAKRLKERELIYDEKDIFFLMVPEVFNMFSSSLRPDEKLDIASVIPNRMIAYTYTTKLRLHERPRYNPDATPTEQDEYY